MQIKPNCTKNVLLKHEWDHIIQSTPQGGQVHLVEAHDTSTERCDLGKEEVVSIDFVLTETGLFCSMFYKLCV